MILSLYLLNREEEKQMLILFYAAMEFQTPQSLSWLFNSYLRILCPAASVVV